MRQPRVDFTTKNAFCFGLLLAFNVYGVALIGNNNFSNHSRFFLMIFKGFVDLSPTSYHQVNETSGLNPVFQSFAFTPLDGDLISLVEKVSSQVFL